MKVVEAGKQKANELSLFDSRESDSIAIEESEEKMIADLKEIRKFLEELYNQLED